MPTKILSSSSPDNQINESEVSTLVKAARISQNISETTIGALSTRTSIVSKETTPNNGPREPSKWKTDVWQRVNLEVEKNSCGGQLLTVSDCRHIQIKMAKEYEERMRKKQVQLEMAKRQSKLNELEQMMESMRISNLEKSAKKLERNSLLKEEQIVRVCESADATPNYCRNYQDHNFLFKFLFPAGATNRNKFTIS